MKNKKAKKKEAIMVFIAILLFAVVILQVSQSINSITSNVVLGSEGITLYGGTINDEKTTIAKNLFDDIFIDNAFYYSKTQSIKDSFKYIFVVDGMQVGASHGSQRNTARNLVILLRGEDITSIDDYGPLTVHEILYSFYPSGGDQGIMNQKIYNYLTATFDSGSDLEETRNAIIQQAKTNLGSNYEKSKYQEIFALMGQSLYREYMSSNAEDDVTFPESVPGFLGVSSLVLPIYNGILNPEVINAGRTSPTTETPKEPATEEPATSAPASKELPASVPETITITTENNVPANLVNKLGLVALNTNGNVYAAYDGKVINTGNDNSDSGYGNYVTLKHEINGKTFYTFYGNLDAIAENIEEGKQITRKRAIGTATTAFFTIFSKISSNGIPDPKSIYNPLCFIYQDQLTLNKLDFNPDLFKDIQNSAPCVAARTDLGLRKLFSDSCDDLHPILCNQNPTCWLDENNKYENCPKKCTGESWIVNLINPIKFPNKEICEKNSCLHLNCEWSDGKCKDVDEEVVQTQLEDKTTTKSPNIESNIESVFLVSSINGGDFNQDNQLVNFDDDVEICAVVIIRDATGENWYSGKTLQGMDNVQVYDGTPTFQWYNVAALMQPKYTDINAADRENFAYNLITRGVAQKDIIQYTQKPLGKNSWCINQKEIDPTEGTFWFRVKVTTEGKTVSSLGEPATTSDKSTYQTKYPQINFDKYSGIWSSLLEPSAVENYGISNNVLRISRKSNYYKTTCVQNNLASSNIRCDFLSTVEALRYVPFGYGIGYYNKDQVVANPAPGTTGPLELAEDFIATTCLDTVVGPLRKVTGSNYDYTDWNHFISAKYGDIIYPKDGRTDASMQEILNANLKFGTDVQVGDLLFLANKNTGEYSATYIIYSDANKNGILDGGDIIIYSTSAKVRIDGKLSQNTLSDPVYLNSNYVFTLIKIKNFP